MEVDGERFVLEHRYVWAESWPMLPRLVRELLNDQ